MYIDDCLKGTQTTHATATSREPLNLGSDELVTINQLVDIVEDIAGVKLKRSYNLDAPKGRERPQQRQHAHSGNVSDGRLRPRWPTVCAQPMTGSSVR